MSVVSAEATVGVTVCVRMGMTMVGIGVGVAVGAGVSVGVSVAATVGVSDAVTVVEGPTIIGSACATGATQPHNKNKSRRALYFPIGRR